MARPATTALTHFIGPYDPATDSFRITNTLYVRWNEADLFSLWMAVPHPELQIDTLREHWEVEGYLHPYTPRMKQSLKELIDEEQEKRFALVAQYLDITHAARRLQWLRDRHEWDETLEVLRTERDDALADYHEITGRGSDIVRRTKIGA